MTQPRFIILASVLLLALAAAPAQAQTGGGDSVNVNSSSSISGSEWICDPVCDSPGTANTVEQDLKKLKDNLKQSAKDVVKHMSDKDDEMMKKLLERLNQTELDIISWWKNMWAKNFNPALQSATDQMTAATADQSRVLQSAADAETVVKAESTMAASDIEAKRQTVIPPNVCGDATVAGGQGRAAAFSRTMRGAWEVSGLKTGLNTKGTPGATGALDAERKRYDDYKQIFCDPDGNGGQNACPSGADPKYVNADTQPTKFITEQLTIDVTDPKMETTVETINNNLSGVPSADPMSKGALKSAGGQQNMLDRRSYLARYAAARSVMGLITSWRMPGSNMGEWVKALRAESGAPTTDLSDNPSYKEIMHAETIDRFNTGKYADGQIGDAAGAEMEKLTLNAYYLMQLRDYYELLERTALVLSVQVSMMADQEESRTINAASRAPVQ